MIVFAVPGRTVELSQPDFAFAFARAAAESAINSERMEQPASVALPYSIDRRPTALPKGDGNLFSHQQLALFFSSANAYRRGTI